MHKSLSVQNNENDERWLDHMILHLSIQDWTDK